MVYTPLSGKYGRVTFRGVILASKAEWSFEDEAGDINVTGFDAPTDGDNNVHGVWKTGIVNSVVTLRGRYDGGAGTKQHAAPVKLKAGMEDVAVFLGFTSVFGFNVTCHVLSTKSGTKVDDAGTFEARLRVTGLPTYPS